MNERLKQQVRDRAGNCCEYCRMPQGVYRPRFPIDHVIAVQHGGLTQLENLAEACLRCNLAKGPNLAAIDPKTKKMVRLYHPRRDRWSRHFRWYGPRLLGKTAIGRATIGLLQINHPHYVAVRRSLIDEGVLPPSDA